MLTEYSSNIMNYYYVYEFDNPDKMGQIRLVELKKNRQSE